MQPVPGSRFARVEAEIAFGALETFLDRPAQGGDAGEFGQIRAFGGEDQIIGACVRLPAISPDQQPALMILLALARQRQTHPFVKPQALRALASGQRRPILRRPFVRDRRRIGLDEPSGSMSRNIWLERTANT